MTRLSLAALILGTVASLPAAAQPTGLFRAYLSVGGNDANPCTLAQPCRLLPAAVAAVRSGGEIWMLDSANYNTARVTIGKPVTILAVPGALGSVVGVGLGALSLALPPGENVTLRNLDILPLNGEENNSGIGVEVTGGGVFMEDCHVRGFRNGTGLQVVGSGTGAVVMRSTFIDNGTGLYGLNGGNLAVSDSKVAKSQVSGIAVEIIGGFHTATLSVTRTIVRTSNVGIGATAFSVNSTANIFVSESRLESNGTTGILTSSSVGNVAGVIQNTMITGSETGIAAGGVLTNVTVTGSTLASNATNLAQSGGATLTSMGNNTVRLGPNSGTIGTATPF